MPTSPFTRKFTLNFVTEWRRLRLPFTGGRIVLAVSGGADSCALAAVVRELATRKKLSNVVTVAHFDHGLRGEEGRTDAEFVRRLAESLEFGYRTALAGKSLGKQKSNVEERARKARYEFLEATAEEVGASAVLTAHTLNDQAETLLLNLIRGSGLEGLAGMKPVRRLSSDNGSKAELHPGVLLVRPLLSWASREDTVRYASEYGLVPREDAMNDDISFARVRVRKELIPLLKEFNPGIVAALARSSESIRSGIEVLQGDRSEIAATTALGQEERIRVSELLALPASARSIAVRNWLRHRRGSLRGIGKSHIESVVSLAASAKSGRKAELPRSGSVVKSNGWLIFQNVKVEK